MAETLKLYCVNCGCSFEIGQCKTNLGEPIEWALKLSWEGASIVVLLHDTQGDKFKATYTGQTALDLMIALNKANLTTNSLQKRILNQLVTDGKLPPGTVTGTPD